MFLFRIWEGSYPPRIRKQPAHFTNLFLLQSPTPTNPYTATQKLSHSTFKGTVSQDFLIVGIIQSGAVNPQNFSKMTL